MKLAISYHQPTSASEEWSTPRGLADALAEQGADTYHFPFHDPQHVILPSIDELLKLSVDALLVFYAGSSPELDRQILLLRLQIDQQNADLFLICELGDEPQTLGFNTSRVQASHLCLSPDARSVEYWRSLGANCLWFTHWADTTIFHQKVHVKRDKFVVTTMGKRRFSRRLSILLGDQFENKYCVGTVNSSFYSSGQVCFQYARWQEITRRIFEAAACGCCVLTNRLPAHTRIEQLFPADQAVVYYDNFFGICIALWKLYRNPTLRRKIAKEGHRLVITMHTQHARALQLLDAIRALKDKPIIS